MDDEKKPQELIFPKISKAPKKVFVQRNPVPSVNRMLDDAYVVLAQQLGLFRQESHLETFTVQKASAFSKLVSSLTSLQETERRRTQLLELNKLTEDELLALEESAREQLTRGN